MYRVALSILLSSCGLYGFIPTHHIGCWGSTDPSKRESNYPFISGDVFRDHCDHVCDEASGTFKANRVRYADTVFVNGNFLYPFIYFIHPHIVHPYILVTHNSDRSIPDYFYEFLEDPKLLCWFGINAMIRKHPKIKPLPIGVENALFGKTEIIKALLVDIPSWEKRENKAYVNFNLMTNNLLRGFVWQLFKDRSYCVNDSGRPYKEYLEQMKSYLFIISPPGYGIDCHRHWEALMMGAIPVMQHSTIDELFTDLPVILVHDWVQVSPEFLQEEYNKLKEKTFNFKKLYADYWLDQIYTLQEGFRKYHFA